MSAEGSRSERAATALAKYGSVRKAAAGLGIAPSTFQHWQASDDKAGPVAPVMTGALRVQPRETMPLPRRGRVATYILTSAQNNTELHAACWQNLLALAACDDAKIMVASYTYATNSRASNGEKRKTSREGGAAKEVWDERVVPYLCDRSIKLAPGLVWCGELQILPTATDPISGMESYTGRDSCIIPHAKFAVTSVASPKLQGTKFVYTTGTTTLRNYIEKKAGQKASFHHGYGALIVEVCHDGAWFVRQLNADSEGTIYDVDPGGNGVRCASNGKISNGHRAEALVWGDIHTRQLEPGIRNLGWGNKGILNALRPKRQVLHDVLDFRSQNHHDRKDPWRTYAKHVTKKTSVSDEVTEVANFIADASRPWCETTVAAANHDEAMIRWLKEVDFREDHENAEFILEATAEAYRAMRHADGAFYPIEWAVRRAAKCPLRRVKFLRRDEGYSVCDENGGIELGMHGDKGANGARGSIRGFARSGRKCIVADSHTAGLYEGAMQVGVMGALDQGYNEGQSSWSHTSAVVYPNGKRSLFTVWQNRWKGQS